MARSIIPHDDPGRCYVCHRTGPTEVHHMIHGANRPNADRFGLVVHLCPYCHRNVHSHGSFDAELKGIAQQEFEKTHTREQFMKIFGRNYL